MMVVACPIGNCHHIHGNIQATRRVLYAKKLLDEIGLGGDRLEIFYMSGGQGGTFASAVNTMVERLRKLGPNPLKNGSRPGGQSLAQAGSLIVAEAE